MTVLIRFSCLMLPGVSRHQDCGVEVVDNFLRAINYLAHEPSQRFGFLSLYVSKVVPFDYKMNCNPFNI